MALSTAAKVFIGVTAVGVGYAVYDHVSAKEKAKKKTKKTTPPKEVDEVVPDEPPGPPPKEPEPPAPRPEGPPVGPTQPAPPTTSRQEPLGGWEFHFEQGQDAAFEECRADPQVTTWSEAVVCVLTKIFPDNRPWGGTTRSDWQPWMHEAYEAVYQALRQRVEDEVGHVGAPGWQARVWLLFDRSFAECRTTIGVDDADAITHCVATLIWPPPDYDWPPPAGVPGWEHAAWNYVRQRVVNRLAGPGLGVGSG